MKKVLISFLSIGAVAVVAVFATQAFFSDTETSTGNTFTAGAIDLTVDYAGYYNNNSVTDEAARKLLTEMIAIDNKEIEMKTRYSQKLLEIIPAIKVTRYIQMENKIRAAIKYELAAQIPLVK